MCFFTFIVEGNEEIKTWNFLPSGVNLVKRTSKRATLKVKYHIFFIKPVVSLYFVWIFSKSYTNIIYHMYVLKTFCKPIFCNANFWVTPFSSLGFSLIVGLKPLFEVSYIYHSSHIVNFISASISNRNYGQGRWEYNGGTTTLQMNVFLKLIVQSVFNW